MNTHPCRRAEDAPRAAPVDVATDHALRGVGCALVLSALLWLGLAALVAFASGAHGQVLVSIDRADYRDGHARTECWLAAKPRAVVYAAGTLVLDCHSDLDGIFANGFDADAESDGVLENALPRPTP